AFLLVGVEFGDATHELGVGRRGNDLVLRSTRHAGGPAGHVRDVRGGHLVPVAAGLDVIEHQVTSDRYEPGSDITPLIGHRGDPPQRAHECLAGQILGHGSITDPEQHVPVYRVHVMVI